LIDPVERITSNYYTVQVNDTINHMIVEEFLKQEFAHNDIRLNFEFGVYDCLKDDINYTSFVCHSEIATVQILPVITISRFENS